MATATATAPRTDDGLAAAAPTTWVHWPVYWSAVWVGALAAIATGLIIGLIGYAVGAHEVYRGIDSGKLHVGALIFGVVGAFFAYVVGGWVTGKIAGILHSEPAMLHGAIAWLVTVPIMLLLASQGAGSYYFGGWYGGLAGSTYHVVSPATPATTTPLAQSAEAKAHADEATQARIDQEAKAARNSALGAVTALLIGLIGSVIGGWLASGEPMHPMYYRTRHVTMAHPRV